MNDIPPDILVGGGMLLAFIIIIGSLYFETKRVEYLMKKRVLDVSSKKE